MSTHTNQIISDKSQIQVFIDINLKERNEIIYQNLVDETKVFSQKFILGAEDLKTNLEKQPLVNEPFVIVSENDLKSFLRFSNETKIFYLEEQELSFLSEPENERITEHFEKIDIHEIKLLPFRLEKKFFDYFHKEITEIKERAFKSLKKIKKLESHHHKYLLDKLSVLKNKTIEVQIIEELNRFEEFSFQIKSKDELKVAIINFWFEYFGEELSFIPVANIEDLKKANFLLPIVINEEVEEFISISKFNFSLDSSFILAHLFRVYANFFLRHNLLNRFEDEHKIWEDAFFKIKTPMALFDEQGELIRHNNKFINLRLMGKECLQLENNQTINISSGTYKVLRKKILLNESTNNFFVFLTDSRSSEKRTSMSSNEELGIVSSSIAHELNNPLAGILAALNVFELEDELSDEIKFHLNEMKKGAQRCRDLIQTFLGFSKIKPVSNLDENQDFPKNSVIKSFEQAFHLIRFRLIENNLKLNFKQKMIKRFNYSFNSSVLAMVFYLILGEIITSFSHFLLVSGEGSKTLNAEFIESQNYIEIKLYSEFEYKNKILESKLIMHLIQYLNLEISLEETIKIFPSASRILVKDVM